METGKSVGAGRGFAFSLDAAAAMVIFAAGLALLAGITGEQSFSPSQSAAIAEDTLYALEGSGYIVQTIDTNSATQSAQLIRGQLLAHLPKGFDANVTVSAFTASAAACASQKNFGACFPDANRTSGSAGQIAPRGAAFVSGSKAYVRKQPPGDCNISYASFSEGEKNLNYPPPARPPAQAADAMFSDAQFSAGDANVTLDVNTVPSGSFSCDQNVDVTLTVSVPEDVRRPIDLMLVTDRSGSMSWDGQLNLTTANEVFLGGNYAYIADGSAGLRVVNVSGKATPVLSGTYNSSGTAYGVFVSGAYAYLSDGSAGLRIVDVSNPSSPQLTGTYNSPGTAYGSAVSGNYGFLADSTQGLRVVNISSKSSPVSAGVLANIGDARKVSLSDNYAYVTTVSDGAADLQDFNVYSPDFASGLQDFNISTGGGLLDLNSGRTGADNNSAAQSFSTLNSNSIRQALVYVKKTGAPGNMAVNLREAITGPNIASATITSGSIGAGYAWETADFGADVNIAAGNTYYLVVSKTGAASGANYYQWQASGANPYRGGNAYKGTTSQAGIDAYMQIFGNYYLNVGRTGTDNNSAAQSFTATSNTIRSVGLQMRKIGSLSSGTELVVNLRSGLTGANLASATVAPGGIGTSFGWIVADFGSNITLTAGNTYYIVLSKKGTPSGANYYQFGGRRGNIYSGGSAYQGSTALQADGMAQVFHRARKGLQIVDISNPSLPVHVSSFSGTDPRDAYISGDTAYLADGSAGLRIIDITTKGGPAVLGVLNTTGTAYDVVAYSDGNAYVADGTNLQVVKVTNPSAPAIVKSYPTPYGYTALGINSDWAFISPGYGNGLTSFNIYVGPKINQARSSATSFVDFNGWQLPPDQMGLVSFNTASSLDRNLTSDKNSIKNAIAGLEAVGGTDMSTGINSATAELNSARHNPQALKFQVLLSDGQSSVDPSAAAQSAKNSGIVIYTIGFGGDADANQLSSVASVTGGQFYSASDANALENVFGMIALKVAEMANDANIFVPLIPGAAIVDDGNGSVLDGNLVFNAGTVTKNSPYSTTYRANFPCSNSSVCKASAFTFPGPGTKFVYRDSNNMLHAVDFNASLTLSFRTRDLNVAITSGSVIGPGNISLDARVQNSGDLDANSTTLRLRLNDTNGPLLASYAVPALCSPNTPGCPSYTSLFPSISLGAEGIIYASINDDSSMNECPIGNYYAVNCYGGPAVQIYSVQYFAWRG